MKRGAPKKVIIADDDQYICRVFQMALDKKGFTVDTVKDGYELLDYLKTNVPHVIVLDLMMPEKDGFQILSAIKSLSPSSRIIIHTGFPQYKNSPYLKEVDRIILKGEKTNELVDAIEELA